jgi:endonuclease/exonuclease/phosphatase family metal-dependent hydrolase
VHLPSGRQEGPAAAVAMQAAEIRAALEQRPDIVLGDFNPQQDGSPLDQFRESGYADLAELFDAADVGTATDGKAGKRNDRAYVAPRLRGRVSDYAVIGRDELLLQDGRHLSDHLPLRFTVTAADG